MNALARALVAATVLGSSLAALPAAAAEWFPYPAVEVSPAFSADGQPKDISYSPLPKAA